MNRITLGWVYCLMALGTGLRAAGVDDNRKPAAMTFVENEFIRVEVNLNWGGAITHVSTSGGPNLINSHDLGRQIQQSYYSGPNNYQREGRRKSPNWKNFPWNPIQTGDAFKNGSQVLEHHVRNGELYVKTVPMLWPMNNDPAECDMETWITLSADRPEFGYRARLTNARSDKTQYPVRPQEVPAIYVNGPWHRLMTYNGDQPFTGEAVREVRNDHREGWPWVNFVPTEGWAALVNDAGTGIGVCVPTAMEFHGGFHGRRGHGDEKASNTGYMSPIASEILDHNIVYEYNCRMILGSISEIRAVASRRASNPMPSWNFDHTRQGWYYRNGGDAGWPLKGRGLTVKAENKARPVRLISPFTFWRAEAAGQVKVRISSPARGRITLYWRGMPPPDSSARPSAWSAWRKQWWNDERSAAVAVPRGVKQWVTIKLGDAPTCAGGLTGLAIDVPDGVTVHDVRVVAKQHEEEEAN